MTGTVNGRGMAMVMVEPERVVCFGTLPDGRSCGQLLARRHSSGAVVIVVRGEEEYGPDGRVTVRCPSCGSRIRIKPKRAAA